MAVAARPEINRTTVGRGALWSLAGTGAGQAVALLTFLVTARYVSRDSFGIMAVSLGTVEFLKRVAIEPFSLAVTTRPDAVESDYDACFVLTLASTALLVAALLGGALLAGALGAPRDLEIGLRLVAGLTLTVGLWKTHEAWLVRHMRFRALALRSVLAAALGGGTGVAMALRGFDLWSLVGQQAVTGATSLLMLWAVSPWRPRLSTTRAALWANAAAARHLSVSAVGVFFSTETDIFVASGILGIEAAGLYNAAKRIMLALHLFLTNSVQAVTLPTFANIPEAGPRADAALRAIGVVASLTVPAALGLAVLSRDFVALLLGERWLAAAPLLAALAPGLAITAMLQFNITLFMVSGRLPAVTRYATLNAALNVAVLPLAALGGGTALALGAVAVQAIVYPLSTRAALRAAGIPAGAYRARLGPPLLAGLAMAALLVAVRPALPVAGVTAPLLLVPLGAAVYVLVLWRLGPATVRELAGLAGSILRRRTAPPPAAPPYPEAPEERGGPAAPSLSLLVCTVGRGAQLVRLFDSLVAQTRRDFEVVLVDQNPPGTLDAILAPYLDRLTLTHVASAPGLSRARNVGLARCRAPLVAFPDDDCWYRPGHVQDVVARFAARPDLAALTGPTRDAAGAESLGLFLAADRRIGKADVWRAGNSNGLFVRTEAARAIGGFDETLGVGCATPFQSGEETDVLLRLLASGRAAEFRRDLVVHHDQAGAADAGRAARYSRGFGRVLRLHRFGAAYLALRVARSLGGAALALVRRDPAGARCKALWALGTLRGYADRTPARRDPSSTRTAVMWPLRALGDAGGQGKAMP